MRIYAGIIVVMFVVLVIMANSIMENRARITNIAAEHGCTVQKDGEWRIAKVITIEQKKFLLIQNDPVMLKDSDQEIIKQCAELDAAAKP